TGLGAAEVGRRELSVGEIAEIIAAERAEMLDAAAQLDDRGATGPAGELRSDAEILAEFLTETG
ncbi:MAG: hypothetical protein KDB69_06705, partial [Acidimicrobiia bacterium]|nr:hypothetical protein [Acidimicrobiia bacterium]